MLDALVWRIVTKHIAALTRKVEEDALLGREYRMVAL
jgi:hypothetical protein